MLLRISDESSTLRSLAITPATCILVVGAAFLDLVVFPAAAAAASSRTNRIHVKGVTSANPSRKSSVGVWAQAIGVLILLHLALVYWVIEMQCWVVANEFGFSSLTTSCVINTDSGEFLSA